MADVVVAQGGAQQSHALLVLVLLELAFFDLGFVVLADGGHATVQRVLFHFEHLDWDARIQEVHRNTAAHGARTNHGHALDVALGRVAGHVGDLAGSTVGHEDVAQRTAFWGEHEVGENLTLKCHAIVELFLGRGFDGVHALQGRRQVFGHAFDHVAGELEIRIALRVLAGQVFDQGHGRTIGVRSRHFAGQGQGFLGQAVGRLGHGIKQLLTGQHGQHFALDGFATDNHVQRCFHANHARQALCAARARDQTQLDFGQGNRGARRSNAVVATQGQFQASAHGDRVNGRDHGLGRVFTSTDHAQQIGLLHRFG